MFGLTKLRQRVDNQKQELLNQSKRLSDIERELTQLRGDRDKLLDQLNLALIETPAKLPERKLVSRTSTEYAEQEAEEKRRQQEQYAFLHAQAQAQPAYYSGGYPSPTWVRYP